MPGILRRNGTLCRTGGCISNQLYIYIKSAILAKLVSLINMLSAIVRFERNRSAK